MSERTRKYLRLAALWAFPLTLWLVATGWYGFDLGKYSDDWAISLRTPETDAYAWPASPFLRWGYFWRPLHLVAVYGLATVFWHHDLVNHAISALAHLGVGVLLYWALRRFRSSRGVAIGVVSLFMTFPLHHEAVLWPAALGSVVSTALLLLLVPWWGEFASRPADGRPWKSVAGMAALTFVIACWHEQAAACAAAAFAVSWARSPVEQSWRVRARRAALVMLAGGVGCAVYVGLLAGTAPSGRRGSMGNMVQVAGTDARVESVLSQVREWILGSNFVDAAIGPGLKGWSWMGETGPGWWGVAGIVIAVFGWILMCWSERIVLPVMGDAQGGVVRRRWLIVFGVVGAIACFVPIAITRSNPVYARYFYPVAACMAFALASVADGVLDGVGRKSIRMRWAFAWVFGAITVVASLFGAGAMVDWQRAYRDQYERDREVARQLLVLLPSPPRGAVFVPIRIDGGWMERARTYPFGRVPGALTQPWSSWAFVQRAYGRSDISATHARPDRRAPIVAEESGVRAVRGVCDAWGRVDDRRAVVPWADVVAFEVDERGIVRIVSHEEVGGAGGKDASSRGVEGSGQR